MAMRNKIRNVAQISKGKIERATGKVLGDEKLQFRGQLDQVKGHLNQTGEKVKDVFKK